MSRKALKDAAQKFHKSGGVKDREDFTKAHKAYWDTARQAHKRVKKGENIEAVCEELDVLPADIAEIEHAESVYASHKEYEQQLIDKAGPQKEKKVDVIPRDEPESVDTKQPKVSRFQAFERGFEEGGADAERPR